MSAALDPASSAVMDPRLRSSGRGMTRRYPFLVLALSPVLALSLVMAGLVPAIPAGRARRCSLSGSPPETPSLVMAGPVPAIPML